jgi:AcrR family transcriptional regulator
MNIIISERKQKTKLPDIMRVAVHLFVKKGIDGTTIKDIAREARVAEGALYRHYKSKEELAWQLFTTHLSQFTAELMSKVYPEPTAEKRIRKFVEESFKAYEQDPELYSYLILQEHSELEKYSQNFVHPGHVVMKIIEDGQKSGEIRAGEPYVLGSMFLGGVIRVCVVKMYGNIKQTLRSQVPPVSDMIWDMLKTPRKGG